MAFSVSNRQLMIAGLLSGALIGSYTTWKAMRTAETTPRSTELIDWNRARRIATSMNQEAALSAGQRAALDREYQTLVERTVPLVAAYTGEELPYPLDQTFAFDRVDWINANIDSFRAMFDPIEGLNLKLNDRVPAAIGNAWTSLNQTVVSTEMGFMLGYLARRVLGQYDLALLGREPMERSGKLYFVHPNIRNMERHLGVPADQFRLWLALHETTHAFEFECHPWLRDYMNSLLQEYFTYLSNDLEYLKRGMDAIRMFRERLRQGSSESGSWIEMVMTPEQRQLFARMQAMMSVVEGYSNHVMNAVGRDLMPDYTLIAKRFKQRQANRSSAEQLFARLTGLDVKLEQYRMGERFINTVVDQRGHDFARRVWEGPDFLPTLEEIRSPELWIHRIDAGPNV